ncbi:MAG TPA: hypothetical protein VMU39_18730 [Solirubrobacteraceae bacterium]|nr:hypothetical protein [Solirubrobacteraceae bacterium]
MSVSRFEGVSPPLVGTERSPRRRRWIHLALIAWWQAPRLDADLAAGVNPSATAVLGVRAQLITRRRSRRRVADGLAGALARARGGTPGLTAAIAPHTREVLSARAVLSALDRRLRAPEPVSARGMAMLRTLLTDGTSPLYQPAGPGALGSRLRAAAAALEPERQ